MSKRNYLGEDMHHDCEDSDEEFGMNNSFIKRYM